MAGSFVQIGFDDPLDPELIYMDSLAGGLFLETNLGIHRATS